ncbi:MAG: GNAT family N-acetyltransferase [Rhizobiaceae bacterium]
MMDAITISNDRSLIDFERLGSFIQNAYWGKGRSRQTIQASFDGSLCFIAMEQGHQVGFARVITDYAVLGYICDVMVFEEHRGRGISKLIMQEILDHPDLGSVEGFMLATADAQGLYEQFGFEKVGPDNKYMRLSCVGR